MRSQAAAFVQYTPGDVIPGLNHVVVECLGAGGQGVVYLTWDQYSDARYVAKLLTAGLGGDHERDFQREVRLMTKLNHPNIVRVMLGGQTQESEPRPYYLMAEEVGAKTLASLLADRIQFSIGNTLNLAMQVCEALRYVHTLRAPDGSPSGAVHRDLKPANLLLTKVEVDGVSTTVVKVLDFGIAWAIARALEGDRDDRIRGTMAYAAPEQHLGIASPQTDLYSLAVILYELIAGRHPFWDSEDVKDLIGQHRFIMPPPPTKFRADLPERLVALVMKNLAKEPDKRSTSAAAFLAELKVCQAEFEVFMANRLHDLNTTDEMPLEHQIDKRAEETDALVTAAQQIVEGRTGTAARPASGWWQAAPAPERADHVDVVDAKRERAQTPRPNANMAPARIVPNPVAAPGAPLEIPPVGSDLGTTVPDPPKAGEVPPVLAQTPGPSKSEVARFRAAPTQSQQRPGPMNPSPTERIPATGHASPSPGAVGAGAPPKGTGTAPMSPLLVLNLPRGVEASRGTLPMADAPALPKTEKARRQLSASTRTEIGMALIAVAVIVLVPFVTWLAIRNRPATDASIPAVPSTIFPEPAPASSATATPSVVAPSAEPAPIGTLSAALSASAPNPIPSAPAKPTKAVGGKGAPVRGAPLRGESPNVNL